MQHESVFPIVLLLILLPAVSFLAGYFYCHVAEKYGIYAIPNFRSLHTRITPRGAGIAIASTSLLMLYILYQLQLEISAPLFITLFFGGLAVSLIGFLDDRFELSAKLRFFLQIIAASWLCYWLGGSPPLNFGVTTVHLGWMGIPVAIFLLVWFYNLFNFIDGIDGMALSSVIFVCLAMAVFLSFNQLNSLASLLLILGLANLGVLYFNWPPAKVFMGDTGTNFNSFFLSTIIMASLWTSLPLVWPWLTLLAYYLTDTSLTTLTRIAKYPRKWYHPHRSHAYQNLARINDSHLKVLSLVWVINIFWLLPLSFAEFYWPEKAWAFCLTAYSPLILFSLKFGPLHEDE